MQDQDGAPDPGDRSPTADPGGNLTAGADAGGERRQGGVRAEQAPTGMSVPGVQGLAGAGPLIDPAALTGPAADPDALPFERPAGSSADRAPTGPTGRPFPRFTVPQPPEQPGPARIVAICNQKGGVGKTTTTINLGAALAEAGWRVLLVDFDPQGSLAVGLGINPNGLEQTVYDLLTGAGVRAADVVVPTRVERLDLLPSNIDLSAAEVQLVGEVAREFTLSRALRPLVPHYDVVLIDCQPSLGLLTVNALTAAAGVLVPLECEYFALRGVALLTATIEKVRERLNPDLVLDGVLGTMYDSRTVHGREVLARVVEAFGDAVFHTVITRTVRFPETTVAGEPITSYAPSSPGAFMYRQVAREFAARTLREASPSL